MPIRLGSKWAFYECFTNWFLNQACDEHRAEFTDSPGTLHLFPSVAVFWWPPAIWWKGTRAVVWQSGMVMQWWLSVARLNNSAPQRDETSSQIKVFRRRPIWTGSPTKPLKASSQRSRLHIKTNLGGRLNLPTGEGQLILCLLYKVCVGWWHPPGAAVPVSVTHTTPATLPLWCPALLHQR